MSETSAWGLNTTGWIIVITVSAGLLVVLVVAVAVLSCLLCRLQRQSPKYTGTYNVAFDLMDSNDTNMQSSQSTAVSHHIIPMTSTRSVEAAPSSPSQNGTTKSSDVIAGRWRGDHTPPDGRSQNNSDIILMTPEVGQEEDRGGRKNDHLQQQQLRDVSHVAAVIHEDRSAHMNPMNIHHMAYYDAIP